jgi:hypothetical protein
MRSYKDFLNELKLTLQYHDKLNPKIWNGTDLKPEVRGKLLQIADKWASFANIPNSAIIDVILVGGNANYNYTDNSDLDLHLVVTKENISDCGDLLDDYLRDKKQLWAFTHDITIYGYDVELYAQDVSIPYPTNQGVFSVTKNQWLVMPQKQEVDYNNPLLIQKIQYYIDKIDDLIAMNADEEAFEKMKEKFRTMRAAAIQKGGEFSFENLIFKDLRNRGYLDRMTQYLRSKQDRELSL